MIRHTQGVMARDVAMVALNIFGNIASSKRQATGSNEMGDEDAGVRGVPSGKPDPPALAFSRLRQKGCFAYTSRSSRNSVRRKCPKVISSATPKARMQLRPPRQRLSSEAATGIKRVEKIG
jgi:hypothetical protein